MQAAEARRHLDPWVLSPEKKDWDVAVMEIG